MGTRAAIFIQRGAPRDKQEQLCLDHIEAEHWELLGIVPHSAARDAVVLVSAGAVDVIVTAINSRAAQHMAADLGRDGRVVYVHPVPTEIEPRSTLPASLADLILRWWHRGRTVSQIALDVGSDTCDVRSIIRRAGEYPDRSD